MSSNPIQTINNGGGNMMDFMKTQLMTMVMMKSMNSSQSNGQDSSSSMFYMVYVFMATALIDFICKTLAPEFINRMNDYYRENKKKLMEIGPISSKQGDPVKTSSITIQIRISDLTNLYGHALLDFITNNKNTKHVSYKKQNFIINQTDIIEIADEFFIKLNDNKMAESGGSDDKTSPDIEQVVELFSYTLNTNDLRMFLNKLVYDYELKMKNKLGDSIYYFNQHPTNIPADSKGQKDFSKLPNTCVFTMKKFQTNRKFSNLFGPEIDVVKKRVEFFIKNKKWYDTKGIPYTLGLLLSGQAGAGKTSTVKCLANETHRHIININLNNDISKTQFENLFFNEVINVLNISTGQTEKYSIPLEQRIYVLEDIDCQSDLVMERSLKNKPIEDQTNKPIEDQSKDPNISLQSIKTNPNKPDTYQNQPLFSGAEKLDLSFLLNILDGVLENPGRIVIMTSNHIDQLDHALIRPGRIDVIADFKKCRNQTIIEMLEFFYDMVLSEEEKQQISCLTEYAISPAEMGKVMFENFYDYKMAISSLVQFIQNKCSIETSPIETSPIETSPICDENILSEKPTEEPVLNCGNDVDSTSTTYIAETPEELKDIIETIYKKTITKTITPEELFKHRHDEHVKSIVDKTNKIEEKKGKDTPFEGLFDYDNSIKDFNSMKSTIKYDIYSN